MVGFLNCLFQCLSCVNVSGFFCYPLLVILGFLFGGVPSSPWCLGYMSHVMRKPTFWFLTWSDTNWAVQLQMMARGLKFRIWKVEGLYYLCSENKGADLRLCFNTHMQNVGFLMTRLV